MEDYVAAAVEVANFVAVVIILVRAAFLDSKFRAIATCAAVHQRELYLILGVANSATTPSPKTIVKLESFFIQVFVFLTSEILLFMKIPA